MQLSKCFVVIYRSNLFFCVHILGQFGLQPVSYIKKALGVQRLQLRQLSASQQHDKKYFTHIKHMACLSAPAGLFHHFVAKYCFKQE